MLVCLSKSAVLPPDPAKGITGITPIMARFPLFERVNLADLAKDLALEGYLPQITVEGLLAGVDNLRHDVYLSPKFTEMTRIYIARLIAKYGNVEDLVKEDFSQQSGRASFAPPRATAPTKPPEPGAEFKRALTDLQVSALNIAKSRGSISLDLLARLAIVKLFRAELAGQFNQVLERCRTKLKAYDGPRSSPKGVELRDRFLKLQVTKKIVLRKAGQELFVTLREVEKESVARMRRSLFGDIEANAYDLFMNRLLFTEDGRDDYLNAEHYVMLGNYDRDPDRFELLHELASNFLRSLGLVEPSQDPDAVIDSWLNVPQNAQELLGAGVPEENSYKGKTQRALLAAWLERLDRAGMTDHVMAAYEVVPLLGEYAVLINPQQLKNALISKQDRQRVEQLLEEHGRLSTDKFHTCMKRLHGYSSSERAKIAGRFLMDFIRYHRDVRRLEALNSAADAVNVIINEKLRELSGINNTLYEFLLPEEQRPAEDRVTHHIILKADIRDSTRLTRTLFERGLNPASYFSLNFYEPVNKLLPKYGAVKVFIEGDAVILAMFEREGEASFGVARTCMLAREIIDLVRAYNEQSQRAGLPVLELGIGICYQDAPPMYLMDSSSRIMISPALNESDRLSSCSKAARRFLTGTESPFNVFAFQTVDDATTGGAPEEFALRYNIGGIHLSEAAFNKLQDEISLQRHQMEMPVLWGTETVTLHSGLVPVSGGVFHRIVVREAPTPHIDARDFSLKGWTDAKYFEVCTSASLYDLLEENLRTQL
jgi:hypothetical protein